MITSANNNEFTLMQKELQNYGAQLMGYERKVINLIASDNAFPRICSSAPPYQGHMIQEGLLERRPFAGALFHDKIERVGARAACRVFGAQHANLQPHSCSQANQAVYHALLEQGDAVLALGFKAGGHLTHGLKINFSGKIYCFTFYGATGNGWIDYDSAEALAQKTLPKLIICGSSAYPRLFDAQRLRSIADSVGAHLMFDLSHEAGLIAAGVIDNPIPLADVATMSLDKTLRGPFGGAILCRQSLAADIDKAIHPGTQSSFSIRTIADKANALILTQELSFREYAKHVLLNAKALENGFVDCPNTLLTGGTDKHYVILDVKDTFGITGREAEERLEEIGILSSRQTMLTDASVKMSEAGGLRIGTAWATSRGYRAHEFSAIAEIIKKTLSCQGDKSILQTMATQVDSLAAQIRKDDVWL